MIGFIPTISVLSQCDSISDTPLARVILTSACVFTIVFALRLVWLTNYETYQYKRAEQLQKRREK